LKVTLLFLGALVVVVIALVAYNNIAVWEGADKIVLVAPPYLNKQQSQSSEAGITNGIAVPPEPDLTINNATLAGVYFNNNGVRDDVERWIAINVPESAKKRANLMVYAKATQQALLSESEPEAVAAAKDRISVIECFDYLGVPTQERRWREVLAIILNTELRLTAFDTYQDKINGQVFGMASDERQDEACLFDFELMPN